jgi:LysM repeat protein
MRIGFNLLSIGLAGWVLCAVPGMAETLVPATKPGSARALTGADERALDLSMRAPTSAVIVREGETLHAVALRLGTSVAVLAQLNNLARPFTVRPGQVLLAPARGVSAMLAAPVLAPAKPAARTPSSAAASPAMAVRAKPPAPAAAPARTRGRVVQTAAAEGNGPARGARPLPPGVTALDLLPLSERPGAKEPVPAAPVARARVETETLR